jgi:hypothetical protein
MIVKLSLIDFQITGNIFKEKANKVQELFASVTPLAPANYPLPTEFNDWLKDIIKDYPGDCE